MKIKLIIWLLKSLIISVANNKSYNEQRWIEFEDFLNYCSNVDFPTLTTEQIKSDLTKHSSRI